MMLDELRTTLLRACRDALDDLDPAALVKARLPPLPPRRARVRVVAVGKAAGRMARGALELWRERIDDLLVVTTDDAPPEPLDRTTWMRAAHPVFDARSEAAAEEALARAASLEAPDVLLALVSGGASSLMALAPEGMLADDKRRVVKTLLEAGAPIREVNVVRRHLSRIKGGRLALAACPARTLTLFIGDVIGGQAHDVGSGPSVPDPTSVADAEAAVAKFAPELGSLPFGGSLAPGTFGVRTRALEIASPDALAARVAAHLASTGFFARTLPSDEGQAVDVAARRAALARSLSKGEAVVIACEPTIRLPNAAAGGSRSPSARGGRAGYVALAALLDLPEDTALLCLASDGCDGSSGAAGALVTGADTLRARRADVLDALARFDDASMHEALGTRVELGATGHNLADVHVLARL